METLRAALGLQDTRTYERGPIELLSKRVKPGRYTISSMWGRETSAKRNVRGGMDPNWPEEPQARAPLDDCRSTLDYDELQTVVVETEAVFNARPLTYVYDDEESVSTPLTPSHLINDRRVTLTPRNQQFEVISVNNTLTKRARHHQRLLQQFTSRWQHEYPLSLRERASENCKRQNTESQISVGDIVLVKSDLTNRKLLEIGLS